MFSLHTGKVKKKVVLFLEVGQKKCFSNLPAHIFDCVSEYIPFVSKKDITNTQTQTKNQNKLTKKRDKQNKPKKKRKMKMLLL